MAIQSVEPNVADKINSELKSYKLDYKLEQESLNQEIDNALLEYASKGGGKGGNRPDAKLLLQDSSLNFYPILIEYKGYEDKLEKLDTDGNIENRTAKNEPNFKNIKIAVIGDLMLDEYIMGKVERISPEAPVPVVKVTEEKFVLGGAANVINNLAALGANVYCGGLVGNDKNAEKLINAFSKNVDCSLILKVDNRPTIVKKRVIAGHQQLLRLDWEEEFSVNEVEEEKIISNLEKQIKKLDAVILSDYNKGLLTKTLSQKIIKLCKENNVIVTVDPKPKNIENFKGASSITPNKKEAYSAVNAMSTEDIDVVGKKLKEEFNLDTVLITRSEEGMTLYDKDIHNIPTYAKEVYDVTGAGDTVISVFTLARAAGATWEEAAKIANAAGGIVVGKIGTSIVDKEELISTYNSIYNVGGTCKC